MKIDRNIPVIFINLDRAVERLEKTQKMLDEYGFTHVTRLSAVDNTNAPFLGCAESHLLALQMARERGFPQVLIIEDDLEILLPPAEFWAKMERVPDQYDVFQLVAYVIQCRHLEGGELIQIYDSTTAAGYVVRSHYYDKWIETMEEGNRLLGITGEHWLYANDRSCLPLQRSGEWYYFTQKIAQQRQNEWSYISNKYASNISGLPNT